MAAESIDSSITASSAPVTAAPLTVASVSKFSSLTTESRLIEISNSSTEWFTLRLSGQISGDPVRFSTRTNALGSANVDTTAAYSNSAWNYCVGVTSGASSRTVYLNAGSNATNTLSRTPPNIDRMRLVRPDTGAGTLVSAELAIWNVVLTIDEIRSLDKGFKPCRVRPQSLVFYAPLVREIIDLRDGIPLTNNGTTPVDHPRVY
jgi:hypothetical protein